MSLTTPKGGALCCYNLHRQKSEPARNPRLGQPLASPPTLGYAGIVWKRFRKQVACSDARSTQADIVFSSKSVRDPCPKYRV